MKEITPSQKRRPWRHRWTTASAVVVASVLGLGLTACEQEEQAPTEQLEQGLDQASEAIEDLREESADKREQLDAMQQELEATAQKQVNLMETQLDDFRERIARLPAEQEQQYSARLNELEGQAQSVAQQLEAYTAGGGNAQGWEPIKQSLEEVQSRFESFSEELNKALSQ